MNIRNIFANIKANEHAVSPIVATFILIIVAVVGATAVGAMMGIIGEDTGMAADVDQIGDASKALIELGAPCPGQWRLLRPYVVNFTDANPGIGVRPRSIRPCIHNLYAVREGMIDVGTMGDGRRGFKFINISNPDNATLDRFLAGANINDNINRALGRTVNTPVNNSTLRHMFSGVVTFPLGPRRDNFTIVWGAVITDNSLQANWAAYLRGIDVQEFPMRRGAIRIREEYVCRHLYFYTLGRPSSIEEAFIDYMRLKTFEN